MKLTASLPGLLLITIPFTLCDLSSKSFPTYPRGMRYSHYYYYHHKERR